jgi:hypothetical protein
MVRVACNDGGVFDGFVGVWQLEKCRSVCFWHCLLKKFFEKLIIPGWENRSWVH